MIVTSIFYYVLSVQVESVSHTSIQETTFQFSDMGSTSRCFLLLVACYLIAESMCAPAEMKELLHKGFMSFEEILVAKKFPLKIEGVEGYLADKTMSSSQESKIVLCCPRDEAVLTHMKGADFTNRLHFPVLVCYNRHTEDATLLDENKKRHEAKSSSIIVALV
ncbi:hypothetical protein AC249_AIPGENE16310 [Exaiptasia diaphana]|nr:hypothetical protein AC249_AIPGENE16310 [Exaiptasia diaphana]